MSVAKLRVFRGDAQGGEEKEYEVPVDEGMVVLDALFYIQANYNGDLAIRWNCKAAKCGSCSTEINGKPKLACKTRMDSFAEGETITVYPIKAFPVIKDLVTDVSWNYEVSKDSSVYPRRRYRVGHVPGGRREGTGIPKMHRVLSLPERLSHTSRPQQKRRVCGTQVHDKDRRAGDASPGCP